MKYLSRWFFPFGSILVLTFSAGAQETPAPATPETPAAEIPAETPAETRPVEVVKARIAGPPGHRAVRAVNRVKRGGGRLAWSRQGDEIAYDMPSDEDGLYDLYLMKPDGDGERCITCEQWDLRKVNALNPVWHPSGEYLIFQAQDSARKLKMDLLKLASPYRGLHSELWAITRDGKRIWQLTRVTDRGGAVLDPHFAYDSGNLVWTRRVASTGRWGEWVQDVAAFEIQRGTPRLGKIRTYEPEVPAGFVVAHGFSPDDRALLVSAIPDPGSGEAARDLLRYDLETRSFERVTDSRRERDDLARPLPRGDGIVWVNDRGIKPPPEYRLPWRNDVWYRSDDGMRQERLTYFNQPKSNHFLGEALIDDLDWSPDGKKLGLHVVYVDETSGLIEDAIFFVELDDAL